MRCDPWRTEGLEPAISEARTSRLLRSTRQRPRSSRNPSINSFFTQSRIVFSGLAMSFEASGMDTVSVFSRFMVRTSKVIETAYLDSRLECESTVPTVGGSLPRSLQPVFRTPAAPLIFEHTPRTLVLTGKNEEIHCK